MSEQLCTKEHATLSASVLAMAHYVCEWSDDATLFALLATLAQHASAVAQRLDQQRYLCERPPSDLSENRALAQLAQAREQIRHNGETGIGGSGHAGAF